MGFLDMKLFPRCAKTVSVFDKQQKYQIEPTADF